MAIQVERGTSPVLVQGDIRGGLTKARVIVHLVTVVTVICAVVKICPPFWVLLPLTASMSIELNVFQRRSKRVWITDMGSGFRIQTKRGTNEFNDDDIFSMNSEISDIYYEGRYNGQRRRFILRIAGEDRPITLAYRIGINEGHPLAAFTTRVFDKYVERVKEALRAGAIVQGDRWSLSASHFTMTGRGSAQALPLDELISVANLDGYVQLWKRGVNEAFCKIPARSQHATLLLHLLEVRLDSRSTQQDPTGLGRVIFERRTPTMLIRNQWMLFGVCCILEVGILVGSIKEPTLLILAGVLFLPAAVFGTVASSLARSRFRCQQYGVYRKGLFAKPKRLRYDEVDEFSYAVCRHNYHGMYIATTVQITLKPPPGSGKNLIRFSSTCQDRTDEAMEKLRNQISAAVGSKMLEQLAQGENVEWTKVAAITPAGIEYHPMSSGRRKEPVLIPFEHVQRFKLQEGTFRLWRKGIDKFVVQIATMNPNFYPGFWALCQLLQSAASWDMPPDKYLEEQ
jgi:hypothetical protein